MPSSNSDAVNQKIETVLDALIHDAAEGFVNLRTNSLMRAAIYEAKHLDGKTSIGWNYATSQEAPGMRFHFDNGVGIDENRDAMYLWVTPYFKDEIAHIMAMPLTFDRKRLKGLMEFDHGEMQVGSIHVQQIQKNGKPEYFINDQRVSLDEISKISSISNIPHPAHPIWVSSKEYPSNDEEIVAWVEAVQHPFYVTGKLEQDGPNFRIGDIGWDEVSVWTTLSELSALSQTRRIIYQMTEASPFGPG